jgi:hypothetical protein
VFVKGQSGNPKGRPKGSTTKRGPKPKPKPGLKPGPGAPADPEQAERIAPGMVRDYAQRLAVSIGVSPIETMLRALSELMGEWDAARGDDRRRVRSEAVQVARDAAPYVHPRLAQQQLKIEERKVIVGQAMGRDEWEQMRLAEIADRAAELEPERAH